MKKLELNELYENSDKNELERFMSKLDSNAKINIDYENYMNDVEWIEMMESTIPYIDNILRNPNRFIVNEEEIVKIELARKITVDSIKHLSKHTNLIQEVDKKEDNVKPSKILNILKEESYDTYENRLIYTLIQNMKMFSDKKRKIVEENLKKDVKDEKYITYVGTARLHNEDVAINLALSTKLNITEDERRKQKKEIISRIDAIDKKINELTFIDVYKEIDKLNIRLIRPPIKKTNLILKNVNFQYAMKLWDYIQDNIDNKTKIEKEKKEYIEKGKIKRIVDETFFIDYLATCELKKKNRENGTQEMSKDEMIEYLLDKLINLNADLSIDQIKELIGDKFEKIKYKKAVSLQEVQAVFKKYIDDYMKQLI